MRTLVFLLEEQSAKALLEGFLPRLLPSDVRPMFLCFEGKQDLEKHIAKRIRRWNTPKSQFVVIRDQDSGDCRRVRARLTEEVERSGRAALVRVACRELEAWVVGDLEAVAQAFERPDVVEHVNKEKFRDPDRLGKPIDELRSLVPEYMKIDGARRVGPWLDPDRSRSASFKAFCSGVRRLVEEATP